jgi:hypothetical protein
MIVTYTNSEMGHSGPVERYADISANGQASKRAYFRNTFDKSIFRTNVIDVDLTAGANSIRSSNPESYAPDIQKIQIASQ